MSATVIGRGPAGLLAASLLAHDGVEVRIVADGEGSLALWSGDLSFGASETAWPSYPVAAPASSWWGWIDQLARIWRDAEIPVAPLPDRAAEQRPFPLTLTPLGHLRPTLVRPTWLFATATPCPIILVDLDGLPDAIGPAQATCYRDETHETVALVTLPRPPQWRPAWGALRYAAWLDRPEGRDWLAHQLARAIQPLPPDAPVLLPGVLGVVHVEEALTRAAEAIGRPVLERPIVTPSVQGIRVRERWERYLRAHGVVFETGHVTRVAPREVELSDGRRWRDDLVIVATGGVLGGGLEVMVSGAVLDAVTGEEIARCAEPAELDFIGRREPAVAPGVLAVGRQLGGWNPNRDHNGGAMVVATVIHALALAREEAR
jgi:glycerol-3-phosphate dehydrogenase subunit B